MQIKDVIQMIKDGKVDDVETFYTRPQVFGGVCATINLTEAHPSFVFRIKQLDKCLFGVKARKIEVLEWLMDGYARQYSYPEWDYEIDPINRIDGEWDFI